VAEQSVEAMDNRGGDRSCANAQTSSGVLGSVLKENEVFLGGKLYQSIQIHSGG